MKIKNILGFACGPIGAGLFGLISIPIAAWVFSPEDIGRLNVFNITVSFALLFSALGLDQAYVREFNESASKPQLLLNCFLPGYIVLIALSLISLIFSEDLVSYLYGAKNPSYWHLTIAAVHVAYFSRFLSLILRMQERGFAFSMSQILPKFLQLCMIFALFLVSWEKAFSHLLCLTVLSSTASLLIYSFNTREQWQKALGEKLNKGYLRKVLRFGLPLLLSSLVYWALLATSTFTLKTFSTLSELAIYSVATSFAGIAIVFQSIFSVVWAPIVYKWVADGADMTRVDSVAQQAMAVIWMIVVITGILSGFISFFLPADYSEVKYILTCCLMQPLLYTLSEITCVGIAITRRTSLTVWVTLSALMVSVILSMLLVPVYGAKGASISNAIAYLTYFVGRTEASAFVWRQFNRKSIYLSVFLLVLTSILIVLIAPENESTLLIFWLAMSPVVIWAFKSEYRVIYMQMSSVLHMRNRASS